MANSEFKDKEVDDILDEIDHNEAFKFKPINWEDIETQIKSGNASTSIKHLVSSKEYDINEQNPSNQMTLLIYSVIIGNLELVKLICDFGGDLRIKDKDNKNALDYAMIYGRYQITELLYYQQFNSSLGRDLKHKITQIYEKEKEAQFFIEYCPSSMHDIIRYLIEAMERRGEISSDLLFYGWYFVQSDQFEDESPDFDAFLDDDHVFESYKDDKKEKHDPLKSKLFESMMKTYTEVLSDTTDKEGWKWMKKHFISSLIWFLPHPHPDQDAAQSHSGSDLNGLLFCELLNRVKRESKKQSDLLLKVNPYLFLPEHSHIF